MKPGLEERAAQLILAVVKTGCYLALFLGSQVLVMLPLVIATAIQTVTGSGVLNENALNAMLNERAMTYTLMADLLTLVIVLTFYLIRRKKFSEALWMRHVDAPTLWEGAALAPGLYLAVSIVLIALPESWTASYNEASAGIASGTLVGVIAVVAAAPVVEEVIFRGLIMTRLSRAMPGWLAVLLSAAVFGACHGHPVWFGYAFVLGTVFGSMDLRAGSIWPSILGHVAFNSIDQIRSFLPKTDAAVITFLGVLVVVAIVAPIVDRAAAMSQRRAQAPPVQRLPIVPGVYDFDPWDT